MLTQIPSDSNQLPAIPGLTRMPAKTLGAKGFLRSGRDDVDRFFEGGLPLGELCEWGAPWGQGGREPLMLFLAAATRLPAWVLWVTGHEGITVYPPAWSARGIDLTRIRFAACSRPVRDLKPVFLDPLFKVIVLDIPDAGVTREDCAFLSRQARLFGQAIIVVRSRLLTAEQGNVWARLRLNCWREPCLERFHVEVVRGLSPRALSFVWSAAAPAARADDEKAHTSSPIRAAGAWGSLQLERAAHGA